MVKLPFGHGSPLQQLGKQIALAATGLLGGNNVKASSKTFCLMLAVEKESQYLIATGSVICVGSRLHGFQ